MTQAIPSGMAWFFIICRKSSSHPCSFFRLARILSIKPNTHYSVFVIFIGEIFEFLLTFIVFLLH